MHSMAPLNIISEFLKFFLRTVFMHFDTLSITITQFVIIFLNVLCCSYNCIFFEDVIFHYKIIVAKIILNCDIITTYRNEKKVVSQI